MRALYPDDVALLELGVALAEEHDVQQAFELAGQLVKRYPDDARYHRNVARLAEATGRSLRALDEYVWLVRHGGNEQDRIRALALARANWDLQAVRELTEGGRAAPRKTCIDRRGSSRCGAGRAQPARCPGCQAAAGEWRIFASRETRLERPAHARNSRCEAAPSKPARVGPRVRQLRERVALYEALGDVTAARQQLTAAMAPTDTGNDESVWQQKLQLELRVGDDHAALETLTEMLRRFPSGPLREQLANMQLAAGRADAALQTLTAAPEPQDESWLRRLARLAWEAGDVNAERRSYERLAASPAATAQDFQRLWELAPDRANALRIALASYRRFDSGDMLNAAAAMYAEQGDEDTQLALLAEAERLPSVNAQVSYWQTRITLHQRRAARAASKASYSTAKHELDAAESLLARAARCAPADALYAQLLTGQSAQTLALGLASDDMRLVARAYAADSRRLSMRERVYILNRLGRRDEALALALQGARTTDGTESDRAALEADARNLGRDRTRYVRTSGEALSMDGLLAVRGGGAFEYAGKAAGIRGEAGYSEYRPTSSADSVLKSEARDVSGQLQGRISSTSLELGVRVRNETSARPFGALAVQLLGGPHVDGASALMRVHVNDTTADTARLRALGVRDAVSLETTLPFGKHVYFNARGAAEAFYTRQERAYLGAGLSLDAGLGTSYALPADLGTAGLRLATRVAPRFARRPGAVDGQAADVAWLSQSSEWAGLGASIGRGSLDVPPLVGRQFCYVLDASAGWLWPASDVGFTAQAGLGMSLAGADMLSISARAGNIVGSSSWSTSIGYGLTFDR
jgi:hypothetical protein